MKIKEPVQSTFCDNGTVIDRIGSLTFITKVKRMKGKAVFLVENLLDEFHRPHRTKTPRPVALSAFCFQEKGGLLFFGTVSPSPFLLLQASFSDTQTCQGSFSQNPLALPLFQQRGEAS